MGNEVSPAKTAENKGRSAFDTVTYQAAGPGQTLTLTFTQLTNGSTGNINLQAAALKTP